MEPPSPAPVGAGVRALVVEDEVHMATLIGSYLERAGMEAHVVHDGPAGLEAARSVDPDVVVLDLGLPGLDGIEVCRQLRTFSDAYVVMVTARDDEVDTLIGLSVGADDYLTKPFSPRELVARIQVMFRRPRRATHPEPTPQAVTVGRLALDTLGREVWLDDEPVALTRTEFDIVALLAGTPRMAFSRRQIVEAVWGPTWVGDEHLVDVHVGHLRRKLGDDAADPVFVRTVRGIGYRMGPGR